MEYFHSKNRLRVALILAISLITFGTAGYMLIEKDGLLNALYMTIITISTVGFGEIHLLSNAGKIFTMVLILSSLGTYAYAVTIITTYFLEGQLDFFLTGYRSKKTIKKMQKHVIICGFGRNGQQAVRELEAFSNPYIVIDLNHDVIMKNINRPARFIEGDTTKDEVLLNANIKAARALITTLPVDADNLYVVLSARALNPDLIIISRASDERSEIKLRMAGVDYVVMPEKVGGAHMANLVTRPDIIEFMEHVSIHGDEPTNLEEIICKEMPEKARNKTIYEIGIRRKTGANIIGFKTLEGKYILNPSPDTKVIPGAKLFVLGTKEQIENMKEIMHSPEP